jgi:hypothetical protein
MARRLPTICLLALLSIQLASLPGQAQDSERTRESLRGISALEVVVEDLPDGAKLLGLTKESIQTDVELKLRLAGIRVVTQKEDLQLPGMPTLYVGVNLTNGAGAGRVAQALRARRF